MKPKNFEQRSYASDVTANSNEIVGNPVVCGVRTQMLDYIEVIEPGALTEADNWLLSVEESCVRDNLKN